MKPNAHILVIRLSAMGDVAITVPVLRALLREHPQLKITVLTRFFYAPMFAQIPNVSVFAADVKGKHKGLLGLWKLSKALKKKGFDAVADLHNVLRSNVLKQFFKTSGIPFLQIDKGRAEKKELTAATHKNFKQLKTTYQRYADVFTNLGYSFETTKDDVLAKEPLSQVLEDITKTNRKVIGIAPFAAFKGKQYPLGLMQDVIQDLKESGMYTILLFGGGVREKELLAPFASQQ